MSDPLIDDANAISTSSPKIRTFAQAAAARIVAAETAAAALEARVAALEQAAKPPPVVVSAGFPKQGVSLPLGDIAAKSSTDQDWILDQIVQLGAGHPMFVRTDWWPGDTGFVTVAAKVAKRPSLVLLPILNYDVGKRPTVAVFAQQAAQLAGLGYPVVNLLNEPNLGGWTAQDAAGYIAAAHTAIGGKALVMGPTVGFNKDSGWAPPAVLAWMQAYDQAGGRQEIGCCTCYGDAQYVDGAWNGWSVIPAIRQGLGQQVPFVVVEGGWRVRPRNADGSWPTFTPFQRQTMTDAAYEQICIETGLAARAAGRVDAFIAYSLLNDASPGGYGLVDDGRVPRPAFAAMEAGAA